MERSTPAGQTSPKETPLGLAWPRGVFSVGHVAIPFSPEDSLYGGEPDPAIRAIRLGVLAPRGERGALTVSPGDFLRISWNPFFPYVEARLRAWIAP